MELIKHRVAHYWSHRAEGFETQRLREFESEKKDRWLAEFARYLPQGRPLRILDVGTGTGFFACLLAEQGHETTGIDLTPEMIDHAEHMAAVPVIPSVDTLKMVGEDGRIVGTVDRETTYRVQTPQVFDAILIKGALSKAAEKRMLLSDDSSAMDMTGFKTYTVAGEEDNIKITTPRDLMIAELLLKSRGEL